MYVTSAEVLRVFAVVVQVDKGGLYSVLMRLLLVTLVLVFVWKGKIYSAFLAAYLGLLVIGAAIIMIGFREYGILSMFFLLAPIGLLWGREALVLPPQLKPKAFLLAIASAFTLVAFFYPCYVTSTVGKFLGPLLLAPMGVLPVPTLIVPNAAIIATRRTYGLWTVVPTWVAGMLFGLYGVFCLDNPLDFTLLAVVVVSAIVYLVSPEEEPKKRSKRLKRH